MIFRLLRRVNGSVFLKNSIVLFSGTMLANLVNYLFHFVMGRMVEPSVYGEVESVVSLLTIVSVPGAAITLVATRFSASAKAKGDPAESRALFSYLNRKLFRYGLPLFLLSLVFVPYVERFLRIGNTSVAVVFLFSMMFLSFFSSAATGILHGWQRFFSIGTIQVAGSLVKLAFSVMFVWLGFRTDGIVGAFLLAGIASYLIARGVIRGIDRREHPDGEPEKGPSVPDFSAVRPYIVPAFLASLSITVLGNADMVLAKYHLSPEAAGLYGSLFIVGKTIFFAGSILGSVLFAMSSEEHDRNGEAAGVSKVFRHSFVLSLAFVVLSVVFFAAFPKFVLGFFFGTRYLAGAPILWLFALGSGFSVLANLFLQYLLSIHRTRFVRNLSVVSAVGTVALFSLASDMESLIRYTVITQALALVVAAFHYLKEVGYTGKHKVISGK